MVGERTSHRGGERVVDEGRHVGGRSLLYWFVSLVGTGEVVSAVALVNMYCRGVCAGWRSTYSLGGVATSEGQPVKLRLTVTLAVPR